MKQCIKCGLEKREELFVWRKDNQTYRNMCKICQKEKARKYFQKNRATINAKIKNRYHNDPEFRESKKKTDKKWRQSEDGVKANRKAVMKRYQKIKDTQAYKDRHNKNNSAWKKRNKAAVNAATRLRQTRLQNRAPLWLSDEQKQEILNMYIEAKARTEYFGVQFVVDHIYALKGKYCSGLHVPLNLQVITNEENVKKHNKMPLADKVGAGNKERETICL